METGCRTVGGGAGLSTGGLWGRGFQDPNSRQVRLRWGGGRKRSRQVAAADEEPGATKRAGTVVSRHDASSATCGAHAQSRERLEGLFCPLRLRELWTHGVRHKCHEPPSARWHPARRLL